MTALPPSGEQFEIVLGEQRVAIVEVGGGIREYFVGERPVLDPYPVLKMCDGGHGAPLIPWPNRLGDGRYRFDAVDYQLALSEPAKHNAIHGLLRWRPWQAMAREPSCLVVGTRLHPQTGYPFTLEVRIEYALDEDGLSVRTSATNLSDTACPYGAGQHPYLSPGDGFVDACTLEFAAGTRIVTEPEHQLPTGRESVDGGEYDFSSPRRIGEQQIDDAFTDLARDETGRAVCRLTGLDGATAELWVDESYPFIMLFTGDTLSPSRRRLGLAVEPMTCAANAFQSGDGLIRLEPGQTHESCWGVRLTR
jgi:aldose 1-epimerase